MLLEEEGLFFLRFQSPKKSECRLISESMKMSVMTGLNQIFFGEVLTINNDNKPVLFHENFSVKNVSDDVQVKFCQDILSDIL